MNPLVELRGFEPLTPSMRTRCATGCATAPGTRPQGTSLSSRPNAAYSSTARIRRSGIVAAVQRRPAPTSSRVGAWLASCSARARAIASAFAAAIRSHGPLLGPLEHGCRRPRPWRLGQITRGNGPEPAHVAGQRGSTRFDGPVHRGGDRGEALAAAPGRPSRPRRRLAVRLRRARPGGPTRSQPRRCRGRPRPASGLPTTAATASSATRRNARTIRRRAPPTAARPASGPGSAPARSRGGEPARRCHGPRAGPACGRRRGRDSAGSAGTPRAGRLAGGRHRNPEDAGSVAQGPHAPGEPVDGALGAR